MRVRSRFPLLSTFLALAVAACSASGGGTAGPSGGGSSSGGSSGSGTGGSGASGGAGNGGLGGSLTPDGGGGSAGAGAVATDAGNDAPPADGACAPVVAAADVDPWSMRPKAAGFGGLHTTSSGGHTDVFLSSPTDLIRIGVRLDWGGTVVFYGLTGNPGSNVIDANDTGRELQIALYDPARAHQPCAATASCVTNPQSCGNSITFLGWDPVQGGDECGHGAKVISHGQVGNALEVVVQPLQWNPDWNKPDCTQSSCGASGVPVGVRYKMDFRFITEHVVEIATEVQSQESFSHAVTGQEWPTLYVSHGSPGPDLPVLLDAGGNVVTLSQPGNNGFLYGNFTSPAPWVSWQNTNHDYGVGLAMDQGITAFQGWRGDGSNAPYFHNVRAQVAFGIDAGKTLHGIAYLALGSFATVKSELQKVMKQRGPFGVVDGPAAGSPFSYKPGASIPVRGWVLDNGAVKNVHVQIDGADTATLPVGKSRPDVCAVYPAYANCPNVGYDGTVDTTGLSACQHLLRVVASDADGNQQTLGERVIAPK